MLIIWGKVCLVKGAWISPNIYYSLTLAIPDLNCFQLPCELLLVTIMRVTTILCLVDRANCTSTELLVIYTEKTIVKITHPSSLASYQVV